MIGQTLRINGEAFTVVGVMPATVNFPRARGAVAAVHARPAAARRWGSSSRIAACTIFGESPGCRPACRSMPRTRSSTTIGDQLARAYPDTNENFTPAGDAAAGRAGAFGADAADGAARRRVLRAVDRRRQRREPADGAGPPCARASWRFGRRSARAAVCWSASCSPRASCWQWSAERSACCWRSGAWTSSWRSSRARSRASRPSPSTARRSRSPWASR